MVDLNEKDELTDLEKKVYKLVACISIGLSLYIMMLIRTSRINNSLLVSVLEFALLLAGIAFGWGVKKSIRVLDLRRFEKP